MINNFILIGFDRSGTSAISKAISGHPQVNLVYRPFNSGPIRKKMYTILDEGNTTQEDKLFFQELEKNSFYSDYVVSTWHEKYSDIGNDFEKEKLHLLITNINHFSVAWVKNQYPKIEQWAIWRDPKYILNSCMKNNFFNDWYQDSLGFLVETVSKNTLLNHQFSWIISDIVNQSSVVKVAFIIAVRNYFLFYHINPRKIISYDLFKVNPDLSLKHLCDYFNLDIKKFSFSKYLDMDLNSIPSVDGYSKHKKDVITYDLSHEELINRLFYPLYELYPTNN